MRFASECITTFSASTGTSYKSSVFFDKIEGCVLQGCTSIKLAHHWRFSQNILFNTTSFRYYSKNNLWWVLFIVKLQSKHCRVVILLKENHHRHFPEKIWNFRSQSCFVTSHLCWKLRERSHENKKSSYGKGTTSPLFRIACSLTSNIW